MNCPSKPSLHYPQLVQAQDVEGIVEHLIHGLAQRQARPQL